MASTYFLLFLAISQTLAPTLAQRSSVSSSSSAGGITVVNVIVLPTQELLATQTRLQSRLQQVSASLSQAQATFDQQVENWYLPSPDLRSVFEQSISAISGLVQQATSYSQGASKLLTVLQSAGSDVQLEYVDRVRKLQNLADVSISRADDGIASTVRNFAEVAADQQVYAEAKNQQLTETKQQMDRALELLLEQSLQVGNQASDLLQQGIREWTVIIQNQVSGSNADAAIARLNEVTAQTMADLARLRPEDIETAMSDAHRSIEDVKSLLFSVGVSSNVVRQAVNPSQLGMFAILARARSIHN